MTTGWCCTAAHVPGLEGSEAVLAITGDRLSVRLSRGVFRLEERHIDCARAVSAAARTFGAVADRSAVYEVPLASTLEARVAAALAAAGRVVDDADAPAAWILADRAGNRVCVAAWPDGSVPPAPQRIR